MTTYQTLKALAAARHTILIGSRSWAAAISAAADIALLTGVIVIVGGLTFLPALTLGPVAEHFAIQAGPLF
jgi:K+-transporting ATPase A subunit